MSEIIVPDLGEEITSIKLLKWLKFPGDQVETDEAIAHIEAKHDIYAIVAPEPGEVGKHFVIEGEEIEAGGSITAFIRASQQNSDESDRDEPDNVENMETALVETLGTDLEAQGHLTSNIAADDQKSLIEQATDAHKTNPSTASDQALSSEQHENLSKTSQEDIAGVTNQTDNRQKNKNSNENLSKTPTAPPSALSGWGLWGQNQDAAQNDNDVTVSAADDEPSEIVNPDLRTISLEESLPSVIKDASTFSATPIWKSAQISASPRDESDGPENKVAKAEETEPNLAKTEFKAASNDETPQIITETKFMSDNLVTVTVPQMGESVAEGTVSEWLVSIGDAVKQDDPLVSVETDKVAIEIPSPSDGVITQLMVEPGDNIEVGSAIATLEAGGTRTAGASETSSQPAQAAENEAAAGSEANRPLTSPAVDRILSEKNLNAAAIDGSGPAGRITKADALAAGSASDAAATPKAQETKAKTSANGISGNSEDQTNNSQTRQDEEIVPMSRLRRTVARRLKEAQNTAAILTTFNDVDMSEVMALRTRYKQTFENRHGTRLGFMSFFVKACVAALKDIPGVNAEIRGDNIVYKNHYDIAVAVGTNRGLVTPVVRDAHSLSLAEIEKDIARLAGNARDGKLTLEDLQGGTFTISNGGVYGSLMSTPIINPPQSGILGMHRIEDRPVVRDGEIVIRPMMYLALSYDHRLIDGEEAVTFLVRVKENIEDPERLMLEV